MRILSFFEKLYRIKPTAFGLDISDSAIRVARLRLAGSSLTLASFGRYPLETAVVQNGSIVHAKKLQESLRAALEAVHGERIRTRYVVASLPEPQAFLRIVQLPKISNAEVAEAIRLEVEANIPLPLSEVYYDWEIAPSPPPHTDHLDILVAAVPRIIVADYLNTFQAIGLKPIALEIDALSIARSVVKDEFWDEAVLIIDIGQHRTTFLIFAGSSVRFTSSIGVSGDRFTEAIGKALGVAPEEADRIKREDGLAKDRQGGKAAAALGPPLQELADQARQYIEFFQTHALHAHLAYPDIKRIILCGDDAAIPGLTSALSLSFRIPVELANPWVNILKPPLREVPMLPYRDSLGYAAALGLALRGYREFRE